MGESIGYGRELIGKEFDPALRSQLAPASYEIHIFGGGALCANMSETPTIPEIGVEGGGDQHGKDRSDGRAVSGGRGRSVARPGGSLRFCRRHGAKTAGRLDPQVPAKVRRWQFSAEYKRRILREANAARDAGELVALLRREGLYSSHLSAWRRARKRRLAGLSPKRRGRKEKTVNPLARSLAELDRDMRRLERWLRQEERLLEIQKASQLLEIPLASHTDNEGND